MAMIRLKDTADTTTTTDAAKKSAPAVDVTDTQKKLDKAYNLNLVTDAANVAKSSVGGLLYGGVVGMVCAYFLKKPIYWGAVGGAVVGGILGHASSQAASN